MGISYETEKFLNSTKKRVDYTTTLMLGRQSYKIPVVGYAEDYFKQLGATIVDSMDISDFEQATLIHDLNNPVPKEWQEKYSVVFDGGTLEHVFNAPQAIGHAISMVKLGGHFISASPANNSFGHGFYQFSPEWFYRALRHYGCTEIQVLVHTAGIFNDNYYIALEPEQCPEWPVIARSSQITLYVIAKRTTFGTSASTPQQNFNWPMPKSMSRWRPIGLRLAQHFPMVATAAFRLLNKRAKVLTLGGNPCYVNTQLN